MTTTLIDLEIGSRQWLELITASKVAAILGVSPWESPMSLWLKMHGDIEADPQTAAQSRGHYLEPAVLNWFFDQHPELRRWGATTGTYLHTNGWAAASPDALAANVNDYVVTPVEAKTAADDSEWGTPGTDEIPTGYAAQCVWTMHVLGAPRIYVPVLTSRLEFREYVVEYDADLASHIEARCKAFLDSLTSDERPEVDSHTQTYESLRKANPLIEDESVDLDEAVARLYCEAVTRAKATDRDLTLAKSHMADAMGLAKKAYFGGELVAQRQNSSGGSPYVKPAKNLPTFGDPA